MNATNDTDSQLDALGSNLGHSAAPSKTTAVKTGTGKSISTAASTKSSEATSSVSESGDETLPPLIVRPAPGYFRFMPALVQDLWNRGAEISLDGKSGDLLVEGFYRNGPMRLVERDGNMFAIDRRNRETPVAGFDELAKLNYTWWKLSNAGGKGQYVVPNRPWLDFFIQKKWAARKVIYIPAIDDGNDADSEGAES